MKKALIIGAGIGGIATSIRLATKGYQVSVFEKNDYPGGKLSAFTLGKYRFDAGPSLFTMPHFVTELFSLAGEDAASFFKYKKKDIHCEYFWEDGTRLTAYADRKQFCDTVETQLNVPAQRVHHYLDKAQQKYNLTAPLFLERSLHKLDTYLNKETRTAILGLGQLELFKSLHRVNKEQLQNPYLVQFFDRFATYNGSDPYQTSGIMSLVQHLEEHYGTFIPAQGMGAISESLVALAKRKGVRFHMNQAVDRIVVNNKKTKGIEVNGQLLKADVVVSNMDVVPTYRHLMPLQKQPKRTLEQERSSSALIFYWGIEKAFPQLNLHNIFFSKDYQQEFKDIFKNKTLSEDPTVYVNISSKDVASDAPEGCENWFVMINAPADTGQEWNSLVAKTREVVLQKLSRILGEDIAPLIVEETHLSPPLIAEKTASFRGALYGSSSNNRMSAFLRHPNFSRSIENLFFCGGSVHPGGGIPLCLLSAKITAQMIPDAHGE